MTDDETQEVRDWIRDQLDIEVTVEQEAFLNLFFRPTEDPPRVRIISVRRPNCYFEQLIAEAERRFEVEQLGSPRVLHPEGWEGMGDRGSI